MDIALKTSQFAFLVVIGEMKYGNLRKNSSSTLSELWNVISSTGFTTYSPRNVLLAQLMKNICPKHPVSQEALCISYSFLPNLVMCRFLLTN